MTKSLSDSLLPLVEYICEPNETLHSPNIEILLELVISDSPLCKITIQRY